MRTLISSILVLGLSAQPILAQQTLLKDADAMKAMIDGVTICDEHFTTKKDIGELFTEKAEEIPEYIKNDSRLLEGYFSILKTGFLSCVVRKNKESTQQKQ